MDLVNELLVKLYHGRSIINYNFSIRMGCLCRKVQQQEKEYLTKGLVNDDKFEGLSIYFSTQTLSNIDNQCLLIFTDSQSRISKNVFLRNVSESLANKVQEYFQSQLLESSLQSGQCIIMTLSLTQIPFNKIAVLCLKMWGGQSLVTTPLLASLQNCLEKIHKNNISTLAITELNEELGIPIQKGNKCMNQALYNKRKLFKIITFLSDTVENQKQQMAAFERFKGSIVLEDQSERGSEYF